MLRIMDRRTGAVRDLFVIDAHHHVGEEIDGKENMPIGKNGSYEMSKELKEEIEDGLKNSEYRYSIISNSEKKESEFPNGLFDQFVVFPMKDHFRDEGEFTYTKSNENVCEWVYSDYHQTRLIGFGRVDPTDIESARKEVKKFKNKYGFLGLKIHPESEKIKLDSKEIVQLYIDCARLDIPIIFHTGYPSDVEEIHSGVNKTINILVENKLEELISQLKIIIGHYDYIDSETFRYLSHPSIYAELSGVKSSKEFIKKAKKEICLSRFTNEILSDFNRSTKTTLKDHFWELFDVSTNWSSKIMIGTDHPFLPIENIVNFFDDILNTEISDKLNFSEIQRILGRNIIDILQVKCRLEPSIVIDNKSKFRKSQIRHKKDQIDYLIRRIRNLDKDMPINDISEHEFILNTDGNYKRILEDLDKTLVKARKAETLAKMLEDKSDIDSNVIYDYCEKGQYQKGIKKLKKS